MPAQSGARRGPLSLSVENYPMNLLSKMARQGVAVRTCLFLIWALCAWLIPLQARAAGEVQWQLDQTVYAKNAPIRASFQNLATPSASHWVGIWSYPDSGKRAGAWDRATNGEQSSLTWKYLPATAAGDVQLAVVGSSAMRTAGSSAMAIAIMMRWRMPPENWCG